MKEGVGKAAAVMRVVARPKRGASLENSKGVVTLFLDAFTVFPRSIGMAIEVWGTL